MIVGNGLLAEAFYRSRLDHSNLIIFASGVSNSKETNLFAFDRERVLIESSFDEKKKFVYFSTCSIQDKTLKATQYVKHKIEMELLIKKHSNYKIFRLPQVVGITKNPNTLMNFLHKKIKTGESFDLLTGASRNIIDVDDVVSIAGYLLGIMYLDSNNITNIATPNSISVLKLVRVFEQALGVNARFNLIKGGGSYSIEVTEALMAASKLGIDFDEPEQYARKIVTKYYSTHFARIMYE